MADSVMSAGAQVATDKLADDRHVQLIKIVDGTADSATPMPVGPDGAHVDVRAMPDVNVATMPPIAVSSLLGVQVDSLPAVTVPSTPAITATQMEELMPMLIEQLQQLVRTLAPVSKFRISGAGRLVVDPEQTSVNSYPVEYIGSGSNYALTTDKPQMSSMRWQQQRALIQA